MLALSADWWHDVAMHIDGVPNRTSRPTYLLRESYREGKKVRKRTLANLSSLSDEQIESIRAVLAGHEVRPVDQLWDTVKFPDFGWTLLSRVLVNIGNALGTTLLFYFLLYGLKRDDAEGDLLQLTLVYLVFFTLAAVGFGRLNRAHDECKREEETFD